MESSRQEYRNGLPCPPPEDLPNPGIEPRSPALQVDSLPTEPPGNPKIIGVRSLSLLQGIFPTQESKQSLLHCRLILYQLSYQGSPDNVITLERKSEVAQSCPALCDPMDCSLPGSSVHGIFQAIVLEWIAISSSRGSSQPRDQTWVSQIVDRCFTI